MRLAILGTRGIPANYGGFETFAEELSVRLAARGHEVTVYGRSNYITIPERSYRGVRLVVLPAIRSKHLETVSHTFLSVIHAARQRYDCILICNAANAIFAAGPRLMRTPVILNVDGIERRRKKWGAAARAYYLVSELLATRIPTAIVTDAEEIRQYYRRRYRTDSIMIAYGTRCDRAETTHVLDRLGVKPRDYVLYVSRLEPENNAHMVIEAFSKVRTGKRLLIVGDAPYADDYIARLKSTQDPRVRFPGAIYGEGYRELQSHAGLYIQATEVGGTHPALVEAMGAGNCVIVYDTPENREVIDGAGMLFTNAADLAEKIQAALDNPEAAEAYGRKARARAQAMYSWDAITDRYEKLFRNAARDR